MVSILFLIIIPNIGLLFIEMKKKRGGTVANFKSNGVQELNKIPHVEAIVARGADEAINHIMALEKITNLNKFIF